MREGTIRLRSDTDPDAIAEGRKDFAPDADGHEDFEPDAEGHEDLWFACVSRLITHRCFKEI